MLVRIFGAVALSVLLGITTLASDAATIVGRGIPFGSPSFQGYTFVPIPSDDSIETNLINTFPRGIMRAQNPLRTPFDIAPMGNNCGYTGVGQCDYFQGFGQNSAGQSIQIDTAIAGPTKMYTLMNAGYPQATTLGTIEFIGNRGARVWFPLIGGDDIRDFYQGRFTNDLQNRVPHVLALNAFSCDDPQNCLGSGGTNNVTTGLAGRYVIDEQVYCLPPAFRTQTLVRIILTDTYNGSFPFLLGITGGP